MKCALCSGPVVCIVWNAPLCRIHEAKWHMARGFTAAEVGLEKLDTEAEFGHAAEALMRRWVAWIRSQPKEGSDAE